MAQSKRPSSKRSESGRGSAAARANDARDPVSPLAVFTANVGARIPSTLTRESMLSVQAHETVGEHGISFDGTQWWSPKLRPYVTLPPAARKRALTMEVRWDEPAKTRRQLDRITVIVRDELGQAVDTIHCRHRSVEQVTHDREKEKADARSYEKDLQQRRTEIEIRATQRFAGPGAARAHADMVLAPTKASAKTTAAPNDDPPTPRAGTLAPPSSETRRPGRPRKAAHADPDPDPDPEPSQASAGATRRRPRRSAAPPPPVPSRPVAATKGAHFAAFAQSLAAAPKRPARQKS